MKYSKMIAVIPLLFLVEFAQAGDAQTVNLEIPTMNCGMCPITVRKALEKVSGVHSANVDFKTKLAAVSYDPDKVEVAALVKATTNAGFPSTVEEEN